MDIHQVRDLDPRIPAYPAGVYKNKGWKNIYDWLGTEEPMEFWDLKKRELMHAV